MESGSPRKVEALSQSQFAGGFGGLNRAQVFAGGVRRPKARRAAAIQISFPIHLHTIRQASAVSLVTS